MQKLEDQSVAGLKTGRIRVLERLGTSVAESLSNPTPWKSQECGRIPCPTCKSSPGACKKVNAVYQISCNQCTAKGIKSQYIGETHRSIFDRMAEHFSKYANRAKDSAFTKHWRLMHQGEDPPKFSVKVLSTHKSATERQVAEAIEIEEGRFDTLLNSKSEWGQNRIPTQKTTVKGEIWESLHSRIDDDEQNRDPREANEKNAPKD